MIPSHTLFTIVQPIEEDSDIDPEQRKIWSGLVDPHEDLDSRPDIIKAKAIAKEKQRAFDDTTNAISVSLYFQVKPWHLQSFREAAQVRRDQVTSYSTSSIDG